ncbi:MAG: hypothetical protein E7B58_09970 [Citrobacter sp.]|jgi:hypothetical protein|uniref:hypothetical protein n=1 Tax=Citrobacter TaxID=544 RepID=UPI0017C554C1|nr:MULTISPECIES: hypothetical protein [Citrobacter]EAV6135730.1 hypothetical protein [Salmonella enterica]EKU0081969.1 hypothetical protein [Citrobacter farmeri]EGT0620669.1 hypothetical protein [Citrobacter braakii]MBJ9539886.1 hypothetical protein [Citrobacter braakii]MBJ9588850.1 hypothetical protein [Citrobacter braakii]
MKRTMLLVLIAAGLLAGCGEKTPKCSSDDAKNLVVNIARKTIEKQFEQLRNSQISGMVPGNTDSLLLKVINVRTLSHNSSIDTYQCAANLQMTLTDEQSKLSNTTELPITYNIQKTDDNNGQFYINVSGL